MEQYKYFTDGDVFFLVRIPKSEEVTLGSQHV